MHIVFCTLLKDRGLQNELKERLFKAYYTEGKNIGDTDTLVQLGEEVGLSADDIKSTLYADTYKEEVMLDQYEAQQVGARGVPFFVFNNKYAVSGAQPTDVFTQVLNKVWEEEKPAVLSSQGQCFCTIDGVCN